MGPGPSATQQPDRTQAIPGNPPPPALPTPPIPPFRLNLAYGPVSNRPLPVEATRETVRGEPVLSLSKRPGRSPPEARVEPHPRDAAPNAFESEAPVIPASSAGTQHHVQPQHSQATPGNQPD